LKMFQAKLFPVFGVVNPSSPFCPLLHVSYCSLIKRKRAGKTSHLPVHLSSERELAAQSYPR
jgi:hypothetical protein